MMSENKFYRVLALIGVALLLIAPVALALFFGTRQEGFLYFATGTGGIGLIAWMYLFMMRKNMEKREELEKIITDGAKNEPDSEKDGADSETNNQIETETDNDSERK